VTDFNRRKSLTIEIGLEGEKNLALGGVSMVLKDD